MLLQQLGHDIVFLLQFGFEMLDFLILGVFLSFDIMSVWLAFKDNGSFFEEQLLRVLLQIRQNTGSAQLVDAF